MTGQMRLPQPDPSLMESIYVNGRELKVLLSVTAELGVEDGGSIDVSIVQAIPRLQTLAYYAWAQMYNLQKKHNNETPEGLIDTKDLELLFKHERDNTKTGNSE